MRRLIRHLAWNDIRSQRLPLLLWASLLALQVTVLIMDSLPQSRLFTGSWIPALRSLVTAVLAALMVQRDSLVGTTAFWRTRPIPRPVLFASKMTSLTTVLVILPWIVVFATFGSLGMFVTDAMRAATAVAVEQAVVTLLAVMAASVTSSLTHFVVAGVAGSTLVTVFNVVLLPAILTTWPFVGQSMDGGRPAVYVATLFVLGLPAIAHQYLTPREWRTAAMVAFTLLAATVVTRAWPESLPTVSDRPVLLTAVNPDAISAAIDLETMTARDRNETVAGVDVRMKRLAAALTAEGQPTAVLLSPIAIDSRLLLSDQTVSYQTSAGWSGRLSSPQSRPRKNLYHQALQSALGSSVQLSEPLDQQYARPVDPIVVMSLPADVGDRHAGERAILTADVTFRAHRYRVRDLIPARRGVRVACPSFAYEVMSAAETVNGATVALREAKVISYDQWSWTTGSSTFVLRNTAKREAFVLRRAGGRPSAALMLNFLRTDAGVSRATFQVPVSRDAAQQRIDDAWFAGAELVRLELEDLGTFQRPLRAEFVLTK